MTKNTAKKVIIGLLSALTLASFSGTASAASGSENVGGGQWSWSYISGIHASSSYFHRGVTHSASAQVGTSNIANKTEVAGYTAKASKTGVGVTRVWWNVY